MEFAKDFTSSLNNVKRMGPTSFVSEVIWVLEEGENVYHSNVNFRDDKYAVSQNGGALVFAHESMLNGDGYYKQLNVYDSYANLLCEIPLDNYQKKIVGLYATQEEVIIVVFGDGCLASFNLRGNLITESKLTDDDIGLIGAVEFWRNGFFVKTSDTIYIIRDFSTLKAEVFCKHQMSFTCFAPVPVNNSTKVGPQLWAGNLDEQLVLMQKDLIQAQDFTKPITNIKFSPDYQFCLVQSDEYYYIFDDKLEEVIYAAYFDDFKPTNIAWCGSDAIALFNTNSVCFIGATTDCVKWDFDYAIGFSQESDGIRIIMNDEIVLIRAITDLALPFAIWDKDNIAVQVFTKMLDLDGLALEDPFTNYSIQQIYDAIQGMAAASVFFRKYELKKALLIALIRTIQELPKPQNNMTSEDDLLMQARDFSIIENRMAALRICEQVSRDPYNIPLTYDEYQNISPERLIKRLCNRRMHFRAFRIAQYINVETDFIVSNWGIQLIDSQPDDEVVLTRYEKMTEPVDAIELATAAFEKGRENLAYKLLSKSPSKSRGVPLLIERGMWDEAISAAADSGDASLLLHTLELAKEANAIKQISKILSSNSIARNEWSHFVPKSEKLESLKNTDRYLVNHIKDCLENDKRCPFSAQKYQSDIFKLLTNVNLIKKEFINLKIPDSGSKKEIKKMTPDQFFEHVVLFNCINIMNRLITVMKIKNPIERRLDIGVRNKNGNVLISLKPELLKKDFGNYSGKIPSDLLPFVIEPKEPVPDPSANSKPIKRVDSDDYYEEEDEEI